VLDIDNQIAKRFFLSNFIPDYEYIDIFIVLLKELNCAVIHVHQ